MKVIDYVKVKLAQLIVSVLISLGLFLYFSVFYDETSVLIGVLLMGMFLLKLLKYIKMHKNPPQIKGDYEIPEGLSSKTHIEVSTFRQDYREDSYMFYNPFLNKIYVSKGAVEDYYDKNLRRKVVATLKHEEGHASRRYRDQFNEISLKSLTVVILGLIPTITDSIVLGTGLGSIVIIISVIMLMFETRRREKLADIYAIEQGYLKGILQRYDVGELLLDTGSSSFAYPTPRERQEMIGKYLRKSDEDYY